MSKLNQGGGIRMFGLRRIGKSTLREYALERLEAEGRSYAYIDGQGLHSLSELLSRLFLAMPAQQNFTQRVLKSLAAGPVRIAIEALAKGLDHDQSAIPAYWQVLAEAIRKALQSEGAKPVLVIDEFTYLVENMIKKGGSADVDRLLASMREWRDAGMTMLLTGSIGLTGLARRHGINLEHVNDLQPFDIPELTETEARAFVQAATESTSQGKWTQAHTDEFINQVGAFYPAFLVRGLLDVQFKSPPGPGEFEHIFEDRVRPEVHREFVGQFNRRFAEYGELAEDEREKLILPALKAIMESSEPVAHTTIPCPAPFTQLRLGWALDMLVEDGFVRFSQKANGMRHWRPASNLAKMWWAGRNWA